MLPTLGDASLLNGLLTNLVSNTLAVDRAAAITLVCASGQFCYRDNGPGLPPDAKALLTDGQCRMRINGVQFVQALLEANGLAAGKDYQFKGRYEAEKNAVIISLEKDEREC